MLKYLYARKSDGHYGDCSISVKVHGGSKNTWIKFEIFDHGVPRSSSFRLEGTGERIQAWLSELHDQFEDRPDAIHDNLADLERALHGDSDQGTMTWCGPETVDEVKLPHIEYVPIGF